jgi:DNA-binding Lrp family transcriptional regulator
MAKAYLRIIVEAGKERQARDALRKIGGVKSADLTTGEQDVIALIEAKSVEELLKTVIDSVRKTSGVRETITNLIME